MTRHWFGQSPSDWTFQLGDGDMAVLVGGVQLTFWNQSSGGVQYTDLLNEDDTPVATVTSADGSTLPVGTIPRFRGPDGITSMWADAGAGTRYLTIATDLGDDIAGLLARVAALESTVATQQTLLSYALYGLRYDAGIGGYPAIPAELSGQQYLIFIGPATPSTARPKDLHIDTVE